MESLSHSSQSFLPPPTSCPVGCFPGSFLLLLSSLYASFWVGSQEKKGRGELSPLGSVRTPVLGPGQRMATVTQCSRLSLWLPWGKSTVLSSSNGSLTG